MSLKRHGKNNKPAALMENSRLDTDYPSREELISQLAQLRSSLDGAYETLESITHTHDPEVTHKVADMVDIINGLHECEFELMDLLAKDGHLPSPAPSRVSDNPVDRNGEKLCDGPVGPGGGENDVHSHAASQEDLSLYGAYAVSSSRPLRTSNELSKQEKSDRLDSAEAHSQIPPHHRLDYIKRLEEIQKVNERLVDRCRRLGLVLSRGFALDKNMSTKMKEFKDIVATKEQAQRKILELKTLMQQVSEDKLDTEISLSKIENDESYGRPFRYESRLASRGATSVSPPDDHVPQPIEGETIIKKPRSFIGIVDSAEPTVAPDYAQFLRGLRQPFTREHGERESAFVPIHNATHLDGSRDKKKCPSNIEPNHGDVHNEVKVPRATANASLYRRVIDGGNPNPYSQNVTQLDQHRHGRSSSARASLVPPQPAGCNTMPSNLFRSNYSKSPPSMQSSSGIGSMNSRSMASLDNGRADLPPYMSCNISRIASRIHEPEDNIIQRSFPERSNVSSNNLNKSYRQPTRSSSFYSELDFRNQEVFPTMGWDDEGLHTRASPMRPRSPEFRRMLSTMESQQITDELNRVLRCRNSEESLPLSQQNWWSSSTELGQADRHPYSSDHHSNFLRGKPLMPDVGRSSAECYTQIMQLHVGVQEVTQQVRNLTVSVAANKTATRDALLQHRFDLHNVTRCIRDVSDMVSESMKRVEGQLSNQTRLIMDIETRLRRVEDNQRAGNLKYESARETREREWQVPGRPDFMEAQDLAFQYGHSGRDAISRERDNGQSGSILNNQIPPGTRANNYWDNFRSYSRQNMLSKSNANVPQQFSHEPSPSAVDSSRNTSSDAMNNTQPAVPDLPAETSSAYTRRNGNGKNLWATSGFYENMSTKKRNKDQKSQSTTLTSLSKSSGNGNGNVSLSNSSGTADPHGTSRDSQPEPDDSNALSTNRETLYSQLSPQMSPFRRDTDSGPFSRLPDFEVPWPWSSISSEGVGRKSNETESNGVLQPTDFVHRNEARIPSELHSDDNLPNSRQPAPKADREKHIQSYKERASDALPNLDDTQSSNQELLDGLEDNNDTPDWVVNALEGGNNGTSTYRSPVVSPLLRHLSDNNENNALDSNQEPPEPSNSSNNVNSPLTTVAMNIRCEESAIPIPGEDSAGRSRSSDTTSNNL